MIKYITAENTNSLFKFDTDTEHIENIPTQREAIRSITLISEPGVIVDGDNEIPVKSGDLVIRFYEQRFDKSTIVVKSKDWKNNLVGYNKKMEEERKKRELNEVETCCDTCNCAKHLN